MELWFVSTVNNTSSRYLSPLWDVRFTHPGPQPQFGPHSNTTALGSISLQITAYEIESLSISQKPEPKKTKIQENIHLSKQKSIAPAVKQLLYILYFRMSRNVQLNHEIKCAIYSEYYVCPIL